MMNGTGTSCAVGQETAIIDEADFFGIYRTYIECNLYRELTAYHYKGDVIRTRIPLLAEGSTPRMRSAILRTNSVPAPTDRVNQRMEEAQKKRSSSWALAGHGDR